MSIRKRAIWPSFRWKNCAMKFGPACFLHQTTWQNAAAPIAASTLVRARGLASRIAVFRVRIVVIGDVFSMAVRASRSEMTNDERGLSIV